MLSVALQQGNQSIAYLDACSFPRSSLSLRLCILWPERSCQLRLLHTLHSKWPGSSAGSAQQPCE